MKNLLIVLSLVLGVSPLAQAGDAVAGKSKTAVCTACHGADGNSTVPTFPKLAGQNERYLIKQMQDIKSLERSVPTMIGQLDNMSDTDIANIAAYYASQTASGGKAEESKVALGERVYRGGIAERGIAACTACHSPTGKGNGPAGFPALAGQHADYIAAQLRAFQSGAENTRDEDPNARVNDGASRVMRDIAFRMSSKEIDAVASYIAGLH